MTEPRRPNGRRQREARLLDFIRDHGRVTVADVMNRAKPPAPFKSCFDKLIALETAGRLIREGGDKGEALFWRLP